MALLLASRLLPALLLAPLASSPVIAHWTPRPEVGLALAGGAADRASPAEEASGSSSPGAVTAEFPPSEPSRSDGFGSELVASEGAHARPVDRPATDGRPSDADFAERAAAHLAACRDATSFMGSVLVSRGGRPLFEAAYGRADLEHDVPNTPATRFRIGSISKSFAAALVQLAIERDELGADDRLGAWFDDLPPSWGPITVRDLLEHRSGIEDIESFDGYESALREPTRPRDTMRLLYDVPLHFEPGTRFEYSSTGYVILAALLEEATGEAYEALLEERVLTPLRLEDTGRDRCEQVLARRARGYRWRPVGYENAAYIDMSVPIGGGALYSTVGDLARWARALDRGGLLEDDALAEFLRPRPIDEPSTRREMGVVFGMDLKDGGYSNGWAHGRRHGRRCRQHGGTINGFAAELSRYPDEDVTIAVASNTESYFDVLRIASDLAALLFGEEVEPFEPVPSTEALGAVLDSLAGRYRLEVGIEITVRTTGSSLVAEIGGDPFELRARSLEWFDDPRSPLSLRFARDASGEIETVRLAAGADRVIRGERVR